MIANIAWMSGQGKPADIIQVSNFSPHLRYWLGCRVLALSLVRLILASFVEPLPNAAGTRFRSLTAMVRRYEAGEGVATEPKHGNPAMLRGRCHVLLNSYSGD